MTIYNLRVFFTINGFEINTVSKLFDNLTDAQIFQDSLNSAAALLCINNFMNITIIEMNVEK